LFINRKHSTNRDFEPNHRMRTENQQE